MHHETSGSACGRALDVPVRRAARALGAAVTARGAVLQLVPPAALVPTDVALVRKLCLAGHVGHAAVMAVAAVVLADGAVCAGGVGVVPAADARACGVIESHHTTREDSRAHA